MPAYAITDGGGKIVHLQLADDAKDVWQIYLGWPSEKEIREHKARGFVCRSVAIILE